MRNSWVYFVIGMIYQSLTFERTVAAILSVWPLQSISTLKFKDYYQLKQYDSFARWIDLFDVSMGATYGNNFHVWRPLNAKETREHTIYQYENKYAWEKHLGILLMRLLKLSKEK